MSRDGWRPHIEGLRCLNLKRMLDTDAIRPGRYTSGTWIWTDAGTGERQASIGYTCTSDEWSGSLRLQYVIGTGNDRVSKDYNVRLSSLPLHYGGRRWYFHCPATGRRVLKLYLVKGRFVARAAIRPLPTYRSQRVSGIDRVMAQRWGIRHKLGDTNSDLFGEPCKPKGMHWNTFQRYAEKDARLAELEGVYLGRRLVMISNRLERAAGRLGVKLDQG